MTYRRYYPQLLLPVCAFGSLIIAMVCFAQEGADVQPWQRPYSGRDATGPDVIALWQFSEGAEAEDSSGNGHRLKLRGRARFVPGGRFGGGLESFASDERGDQAQGAITPNDPRLTPPGPFTLELWIKPKPELAERRTAFLLDKKYYHYVKDLPQANRDYCLLLSRSEPDRWRIVAWLGYGSDSAAFHSEPVSLEAGQWYHIAFTYDGAGTGRFFLNGKPVGRVMHEGRGPVAAGAYALVIGDRYGSIHAGLPAIIDQVRIVRGVVPFFSGGMEIDVAGSRTAFLRMEKPAAVRVVVRNDTGKPASRVVLQAQMASRSQQLALPDLIAGQEHVLQVPLDSTLRPDTYTLALDVFATAGRKQVRARRELPVTIVARPLPHTMPVVMWGTGDLETVKQIGFTHQLIQLADYDAVWRAGRPTPAADSGRLAELAEKLNAHLAQQIGAIVSVAPGRWVMRREELKNKFQRIDRTGKPTGRENACARFPQLQSFAYNVGASIAQTFGAFPALQAALIHTEIRDGTALCFHQHDRQAFRAFAGYDIPDQARSKWGVQWSKMKDFPANRIVPDDHPILTFYRWFWKEGDGWNELHTQVHRGLKSTGRKDLWTFFDPAVRVPSVWGSGGEVDVISQWTYCYPDPIKIGQATDELFAMAAGRPGQQVMKMTQIIWYRSQTAPKLPQDPARRADWEKQLPEARFITIAPDHLREAFWSKISRPVRGIMYHGWGSLVPASHGSYRYTNPKTRQVLSELIRDVVRPLGPTLLQVPDRPADVGLLESFASQVFAGRGTWGWSHRWEADMHLILQWAALQPRILYDETVLRDGMDGLRILVLPNCDVLTEKVARAITQFQQRGGIIVADENLAPAIKPDILLTSYRRTGKADEDKRALQAKAAQLRKALDGRYQRPADSSNPDVIVRLRRYGSSDYLFALNDRRTFGHYVGHHGKVMEKGLPCSAELTINRPRGFVYDLVAHRPVPATARDGQLLVKADFGPGGGRLLMITSQQIAGPRLRLPSRVRLGAQAAIELAVVDAAGRPIDAVVPVRLDILDPQQRPAEGSGYYAAAGGRMRVTFQPAPNDLPGKWTVRARELASGTTSQQELVIESAR